MEAPDELSCRLLPTGIFRELSDLSRKEKNNFLVGTQCWRLKLELETNNFQITQSQAAGMCQDLLSTWCPRAQPSFSFWHAGGLAS